LIGWASRRTKAAMHTAAQNGISLLSFGRVLNEISEIGLHFLCSEICIHAAWIKDTGRIKGVF
jgi:hypothetical protein